MSTTKDYKQINFDLKYLQETMSLKKFKFEEIFEIVESNLKNNKNYQLNLFLRFLIDYYANKLELDRLCYLLELMIKYDTAEYEFNYGLKLLITHNKLPEILNLFEKNIFYKIKIYNIHTLFDTINKCFVNKFEIKKIYEIFKLLILNSYDLSQNHWRIIIEGLITNTKYEHVEELLQLYPYKVFIFNISTFYMIHYFSIA